VKLRSFVAMMTRGAAVAVWTVGIAVAHMALPVVLARITRRLAFPVSTPVRLVGLPSLAGGLAGVVWSLSQHFRAVPASGYKMALTPDYLLQAGPYRYSRNPMYVGELAMWGGWSLLLRSPTLAGATVLLGLGMSRAVMLEEAALATRFGRTWEAYAAQTHRWLARLR
jgi:protein-S-isoprenylcysteine O-methyltransferase Ste14